MRSKVVLAVMLAVLAGSCGGENRSATEPTSLSLTLDWTPNPDHVALFYAQQRAWFAAEGLRVTMRAPSDPTTPLKLVAASRTDLAVSYEPELFFAAQRGLPVIAVAAVIPRALSSVIARKPGIHSLAALAGGSIGITGVPTDEAFLITIRKHAGLEPEALKVVRVGYNLVPALLSGKVDAILGAYRNIEGIELRRRGLDPSIIPVDRAGVPPYAELVLVANAERLKSDRAYAVAVRGFVAALARGVNGARADPKGALRATEARTEASEGFLRESVPATLAVLGSAPCLTPSAWRRFGAWMHQTGLLKQTVPSSDVMTTAYLPAACGRG